MRSSSADKPPTWDCGYRVKTSNARLALGYVAEYVDPWGWPRRLTHVLDSEAEAEAAGRRLCGRKARKR